MGIIGPIVRWVTGHELTEAQKAWKEERKFSELVLVDAEEDKHTDAILKQIDGIVANLSQRNQDLAKSPQVLSKLMNVEKLLELQSKELTRVIKVKRERLLEARQALEELEGEISNATTQRQRERYENRANI
jgi:hypothetical protein